ncbi:MAG: ornithine carbamoyltransferase [Candidatus Bilamarchaeaceae archaeon]
MALKNLKGRHLLSDFDLNAEEYLEVLDLAQKMKSGKVKKKLTNKSLIMLFQKPSTRTRLSFEIGMTRLGGHAVFVDISTTQLGRGETIADTARVMARYADIIMARLNSQKDLEEIARYSKVPVINALTDMFHPCQVMADLLTVKEKKGKIAGLKIAFLGDCGFNMFNSTAIAFSKLGADVYGGCPNKPEYRIKQEILERALKDAKGKIVLTEDPIEAVKDADVVMTDTWVSMGQKDEEKRIKDLSPYQVNPELMKHAKPDAIFMHCLPAHRGHEVVDEVADSEQSVIFDQAENRLHAQNAIMVALLGE